MTMRPALQIGGRRGVIAYPKTPAPSLIEEQRPGGVAARKSAWIEGRRAELVELRESDPPRTGPHPEERPLARPFPSSSPRTAKLRLDRLQLLGRRSARRRFDEREAQLVALAGDADDATFGELAEQELL